MTKIAVILRRERDKQVPYSIRTIILSSCFIYLNIYEYELPVIKFSTMLTPSDIWYTADVEGEHSIDQKMSKNAIVATIMATSVSS